MQYALLLVIYFLEVRRRTKVLHVPLAIVNRTIVHESNIIQYTTYYKRKNNWAYVCISDADSTNTQGQIKQ